MTKDYRYGFQNQEKDDEVKGKGNSVNSTFRMHDPRIGRFFAVDPLARKYPYFSPYAFSGNLVISTFELEGLEPNEELNGVNLMTAHPGGIYVAPNFASSNIDVFSLFDWKLKITRNSRSWDLIGEHQLKQFPEVQIFADRLEQPVLKTGTQKMIDEAWNKGEYVKALKYWGNDWDSKLQGEEGFRIIADKAGYVGKVMEASRIPIISQMGVRFRFFFFIS